MHRFERLNEDTPGDDIVSRLVNQDLAGLGRDLQPLRQVDRIPLLAERWQGVRKGFSSVWLSVQRMLAKSRAFSSASVDCPATVVRKSRSSLVYGSLEHRRPSAMKPMSRPA